MHHANEGLNSLMHDAGKELLNERIKKIIEQKAGKQLDEIAERAAGLFISHTECIKKDFTDFISVHKNHNK